MTLQMLFPTAVYRSKLSARLDKNLNQALLRESYQFAKTDDYGQKWSEKNYPGGYTSYASLPALNQLSPYFADLKKNLDQHIFLFAKSLEMDIRPKELQLSSLWINIMPRLVSHSMHLHPLSVVSGTYYVQTPKNSSALKFEDPRLSGFMGSPPRKPKARIENQRFVSLEPKAGELILFESWLKHEVPPNLSAKDRVSVSFNYDWV